MNTLLLIKNSSVQASDGRLAVTLIYEGHSTHAHVHMCAHTQRHNSVGK